MQAALRTTVADTPADAVDAHVPDEWSLAQTLRHLTTATDAWRRGGILRIEQPFHEIGQIFTGAASWPRSQQSSSRRNARSLGGGGEWHPTVGDCIRVIVEEQCAHLRYIRRDLALLR